MTKAEVVSKVAEEAGITRAQAARAVAAVLDANVEAPGPNGRLLSRRPGGSTAHKKRDPSRPQEQPAVSEIRELAVRVWESPADAEEFLTTPHALLDGETPVSAARTPEGMEQVRKILLALEYGLPV